MSNCIHGCDICQEVCPSNRNLDPREVDPRAGFDPQHHSSHKYLDGLEEYFTRALKILGNGNK